MSYYSSNNPRSISTTTIMGSIPAVTAATGAALLVRRFGFEGAFWYVWEGDPYPPRVRYEFGSLDEQAAKLAAEVKRIETLEIALERAKLDTIDGISPIASWVQNVFPNNLEKILASLSYNLDQIAAKVDAVPSSGHADIKLRKKALSGHIVAAMERADVLIKLFKEGSQST